MPDHRTTEPASAVIGHPAAEDASLPMKIGTDVIAGLNPAAPEKDEAVICWGEKCAGNYSVPFGIGATARLVHAVSCACARKQHGWKIT